MGGYVEVAKVSDIGHGMMKKVVAGEHTILLANVQGRLYATAALCPHLQADLSTGTLHGTVLTCPLHGSEFDVRDGHVVRWTDLSGTLLAYAAKARPPLPLPTYAVRTDGDRVLVDIG